jgi:hypothetical protein
VSKGTFLDDKSVSIGCYNRIIPLPTLQTDFKKGAVQNEFSLHHNYNCSDLFEGKVIDTTKLCKLFQVYQLFPALQFINPIALQKYYRVQLESTIMTKTQAEGGFRRDKGISLLSA